MSSKEKAELADHFLDMTHCVGGHLVVRSRACPRCKSTDPYTVCRKEKLFVAIEAKEVYTGMEEDKKLKAAYKKYAVKDSE